MLARLLGDFLADVAWFANTLSMLHMVNTPSAVCQGSCCASAVHVFLFSDLPSVCLHGLPLDTWLAPDMTRAARGFANLHIMDRVPDAKAAHATVHMLRR